MLKVDDPVLKVDDPVLKVLEVVLKVDDPVLKVFEAVLKVLEAVLKVLEAVLKVDPSRPRGRSTSCSPSLTTPQVTLITKLSPEHPPSVPVEHSR